MNVLKIIAGVAGGMGLLIAGFKAGEENAKQTITSELGDMIIKAQQEQINELKKNNE